MARDHYLPASVIGRFSTENVTSARQRRVYVLRKGHKIPFQTKAENIGYVNDLYRVSKLTVWDSTGTSVDPLLHGYEPTLPAALDLLEQAASIDLVAWLRTLVPYVAGIFVRGQDFIPRFMGRPSVAVAGEFNTAENANNARIIEFERMLAPVCCARWVVLHKNSGESFVLNDLGATGTFDKVTGESGWAIPIGKDSVLGIFPKEKRSLAYYQGGEWRAVIEHRPLNGTEAKTFNDSTAHLATSFVIGSDQAELERLAPIVAEHGDASALMDSWPIGYKARLAHAQEWHRLVSATATNPPPDAVNDLQSVDPRILAMGWCPPVGIGLNIREFPTGLKRVGNVIRLSLEIPANYQDYFIRPDVEQTPE
jgi:hypothetical protein